MGYLIFYLCLDNFKRIDSSFDLLITNHGRFDYQRYLFVCMFVCSLLVLDQSRDTSPISRYKSN
jgi:hypothetical protein